MDTLPIAIIVSLAAAGMSLVSLLFTVTSKLRREIRVENIKRILPPLEDLGINLYGMIAAITLLHKDRSIKNQKYWKNQIAVAQKNLRALRSTLRYPLWGLDEAIKMIILLPELAKLAPEKELSHVIVLATDLRVAMDHVIRKCYTDGSPPGFFARRRVRYRVNKLLTKWEDLKAQAQEETPLAGKPVAKTPLHKTETTVIEVRKSDFDTRDQEGNIYTIKKRSKVDSKSSRHLMAGTPVWLFKRDIDRDLHYSFIRKDLTADRPPAK
jgi:hypothetical protein